MKNILLTIKYDGTNFAGWQRQPDQRTVQGEIERVLSILCKQNITLHGASRTDSGVHSFDQKACFKGKFGIPVDKIPKAANNLLASDGTLKTGDVMIVKAEEVDMDFHPRFNALGKKYIYIIHNGAEPDIMQRNFCYYIHNPLDIPAMQTAASMLVGEHDFRCFMASGGKIPKSTVRNIFSTNLFARSGDKIEFHIIGDGFLYNMVRIIVGTLIDIGSKKISANEMSRIIAGKDRRQAGHTAPPQGLYLAKVFFDKGDIYEDKRYV